MNNYIKAISLLGFLVFLLQACQPAHKDSSEQVLWQTDSLVLTVAPGSIVVETPLLLSMQSAEPISAISGELQGISMYMGRIPLQWQQVEGGWQSTFLLGACSDPNMRWRLALLLEYTDGRQVRQQIEFQSSWR